MSRFKAIGLLLLPCLGLQIGLAQKVLTTEVATTQTKSTYADYDTTSLRSAGLAFVAAPLRVSANICPADLETLIALLLRDLPSYANRVIQQSRNINRKISGLTHVIIAGRPEFTPLPLNPSEYSSFTPEVEPAPPQQVFFTTLERQYVAGKAAETQHFHWLFLSKTPDGWRLAMMFSQFGSSEKGSVPTPPQESSNGIIGQAVTTWLRDCRAGAIRPLRK
jgi:hypothetical protein